MFLLTRIEMRIFQFGPFQRLREFMSQACILQNS